MGILVLGHRGMLGQMAVRYFSARGVRVTTIAERFTMRADCPALARIAHADADVILNCVGRIKQKAADRQALFDVNAVLPLQLVERMRPDQFLVHPSTDCVFAGDRPHGRYRIDDPCDAIDDYGWSKRLGEVALAGQAHAAVVRVSIIGPDDAGAAARGLLGWFLCQPDDATLSGYANHYWNGITTLEWCRLVDRLYVEAAPDMRRPGMIQPGTAEVMSKLGMLELFQATYGTQYSILRHETDHALNRALEPTVVCPPLAGQLQDLVGFDG